MRAAVLTELGRTPEVTDFAEPAAGDGQVVAEVLAGAINPIDLRVASGALAGMQPDTPCVVGSEGVGRLEDGRRVYFRGNVAPWGSLAQRTAIYDQGLAEIPDDLDPAVAVAFGIAGTAAWLGLSRRGGLQRGERVLVLGASGVVGLIAVQAAKLMGAAHVTAAARSAAGLQRALDAGADAGVRLDHEGEELTASFLEAAGGPVDLVFDPLWGAPASAALEALAQRGRLVQLGQSAGAQASFSPVNLRFKELAILGYTNFMSTPEQQNGALQAMWRHAAAGELRVDVETYPLDEAPAAWERQAASPGHKIVIVP